MGDDAKKQTYSLGSSVLIIGHPCEQLTALGLVQNICFLNQTAFITTRVPRNGVCVRAGVRACVSEFLPYIGRYGYTCALLYRLMSVPKHTCRNGRAQQPITGSCNSLPRDRLGQKCVVICHCKASCTLALCGRNFIAFPWRLAYLELSVFHF